MQQHGWLRHRASRSRGHARSYIHMICRLLYSALVSALVSSALASVASSGLLRCQLRTIAKKQGVWSRRPKPKLIQATRKTHASLASSLVSSLASSFFSSASSAFSSASSFLAPAAPALFSCASSKAFLNRLASIVSPLLLLCQSRTHSQSWRSG